MLLRAFEHSQVYHPSNELLLRLEDVGFPGEEVWLTTADKIRLHAWYFPAPAGSPRKQLVVLYCHGNGGNISHRKELYHLWHEAGVNLLAFDYRGYGLSAGKPDEPGTYEDVRAAYNWLRKQGFTPEQIIVEGESLGGGVASWLAAKLPVAGLVLQSTFSSTTDLGRELFPWLPVRLLASIHYDTHARLPKIYVPVLILHSRGDTLIKFHHAEKNFAAANEPKWLREVAGDHNDALYAKPELYHQAVEDFLQQLASRADSKQDGRP